MTPSIIGLCIVSVLFGICSAHPPFEPPVCPENLVFEECGSDCNLTCDMPVHGTCNRKCVARCECPLDKPVLHNGRCITRHECPKNGQTPAVKPSQLPNMPLDCPEDQQYQPCGSKCNRTCADGLDYPSCHKVCVRRCGCPYERSYWHEGKCIAFDKCPQNSGKNNDGTESESAKKERELFYMESLQDIAKQLRAAFGIKLQQTKNSSRTGSP